MNSKIFQIALGIMTAVGGFIDIGDLVFATAAGAQFGYQLLWVVILGVAGILIYSEMSGRVAATIGRPVFDLIQERTSRSVGLGVLAASEVVNIMTCAAEIGGVAIILRLFLGLPYRGLILIALAALVAVVWFLSFDTIERVFGLAGLGLLVFAVTAVVIHPNWGQIAAGFMPTLNHSNPLTYAYYAVGIFSAALMPYEVYFYSSGAIEEGWKKSDLKLNTLTAVLGYSLGSLLVLALIIMSAKLFIPQGIVPQLVGTAALGALLPLGKIGLLIALVGMLFAIGGASIETCFAGAYNISQFFGWDWGKHKKNSSVPRFTRAWLVIFGLALAIIMTGIDAVKLTEYAVIFSVAVMPLTYLPILLVSSDRKLMGEHANNRFINLAGWFYFALIMIAATTAVPLMILTHLGQG